MRAIKKSDLDEHSQDGTASTRPPARVSSTTRVNVAFPFSQVKLQEPSDQLIALTELVADLAGLLADIAPGPDAEQLESRATALVRKLD